MLGTSSQRLLTSGNFPRVLFEAATSQLCNFPSGNFPSLSWPQRSASLSFLVTSLSLQPAAPQEGNCRLVYLTFGKLLLGKLSLGKIPRIYQIVRHPLQVGFLGQNKIRKCYFKISLGSLNILYVLIKRLCHLL